MVLFAFSMEDQVEKYGAYVGIAAFFGLAVLSLLYFSQARELKRLREWAGRAPERAQELEQRVVAQAAASVAAAAPAQAGQAPATGTGTLAPPRRLAEMPAQTARRRHGRAAVGVAERAGTNGTGSVPALGPGGTVPAGRADGAPVEEDEEERGATRPFNAAEAAAATGAAAAAAAATPPPVVPDETGDGPTVRRADAGRATPTRGAEPDDAGAAVHEDAGAEQDDTGAAPAVPRATPAQRVGVTPKPVPLAGRRRPPARARPAAARAGPPRPRPGARPRAPAAAVPPARSPCSSASPS